MIRFSPKKEIINHFDDLIKQVDIEFEQCLKKYKQKEQTLGDLECFSGIRIVRNVNEFDVLTLTLPYNWDKEQTLEEEWSESTKVVDYLNQIRIRTVEKLGKERDEAVAYYNLNSSKFKSFRDENRIEDFRSEFFGEKFYFQVNFKQSEKRLWVLNVFTFVTDFYMSQYDIDSFE